MYVLHLQQEMREYPTLLRQAVSLARRLQDPLVEFAQLCNADEDILCLKYHPLQVFISAFKENISLSIPGMQNFILPMRYEFQMCVIDGMLLS